MSAKKCVWVLQLQLLAAMSLVSHARSQLMVSSFRQIVLDPQAAERRAQEAEEEQYRAEQEAAAASAELRAGGGGGGQLAVIRCNLQSSCPQKQACACTRSLYRRMCFRPDCSV